MWTSYEFLGCGALACLNGVLREPSSGDDEESLGMG